jgi:hypothetical protein
MLSLPDCLDGVQRHAVNENAHRLMQGWYFRHAANIYALPPANRGQGRGGKSVATVATGEGISGWLAESASWISLSTAYNYMRASETAGLTLAMSEPEALAAATAALEKFAAEKGWKFSALYKALPEPEPEKPLKSKVEVSLGLYKQAWLDFGEQMGDFAHTPDRHAALTLLSEEEFATLKETAEHTLAVLREAEATRKTAAAAAKGKGKK